MRKTLHRVSALCLSALFVSSCIALVDTDPIETPQVTDAPETAVIDHSQETSTPNDALRRYRNGEHVTPEEFSQLVREKLVTPTKTHIMSPEEYEKLVETAKGLLTDSSIRDDETGSWRENETNPSESESQSAAATAAVPTCPGGQHQAGDIQTAAAYRAISVNEHESYFISMYTCTKCYYRVTEEHSFFGNLPHEYSLVDLGHGSGTTHSYKNYCGRCQFTEKTITYTCPGKGNCIYPYSQPTAID